jgi:serine phosphatase RsbU (regulator of sigma subunit)
MKLAMGPAEPRSGTSGSSGGRRDRGRFTDPRPGPWAIALLGVLALVGVTVLGAMLTAEFDRDAGAAALAQDGATLAATLIVAIDRVQIERGLAELRGTAGPYDDEYLRAVEDTDAMIARATEALDGWSATDPLSGPAPPLESQLQQARTAGDESVEFDLYSGVVESLLTRMTELISIAPDPEGAANRSAVVRLVRAAEALGRRRAVVGSALSSGAELDRDLLLRVQVNTRDFAREVQAASALLPPEFDPLLVELATGDATRQTGEIVSELAVGAVVSVEDWREVANLQIEEVRNAAIVVNDEEYRRLDRLGAEARTNLMWSVAILGGASLVSLITAWAGFTAGRQRRRALREHVALVDGLRSWFVSESLPTVDGLEVEAIYRASDEYTRAGGDWFEVFPLADGRVILGVGDVVGHGSQAVAGMVMIKNMMRGQAVEGEKSLPAAIQRLDHAVADTDLTATLQYCIWHPDRRALEWVNAGHPPGILHTPDGGHRLLGGGPTDALLGIASHRRRTSDEAIISPGTTLILYTDGLVERPGTDLTTAIEALTEIDPRSEEHLAEALLARRADQRDDVAILVVKW